MSENRVFFDADSLEPAKNLNGQVGPVCNNCGGYGYTMHIGNKEKNITPGAKGCAECDGTGVALPSNREIQNQLSELKNEFNSLKKAILKVAEHGEIQLPKRN